MAKSSNDAKQPANADYEVGYGKPPREHQFKKNDNRSRTRSGKSSSPAQTGVAARLDRPLTVQRNGKPKRVHPHEIQMLSLGRKALEGNCGAMKEFLNECEKAGLLEPELIERISNVFIEPDGVNTHILHILLTQHGLPPWDPDVYNDLEEAWRRDWDRVARLQEEFVRIHGDER